MYIEKEIKNNNWDSLALAGFKVIRDIFILHIEQKLKKAVLEQVVLDRKGDRIDEDMVKEVLTNYVTLGYADVYIKMDNGVYQWSPTTGT